MDGTAPLGTASAMGRLEEAAKCAARQYRWGRVRFYVALVGLGVVSLAFAAVAVAYVRADAPDADQAVAARTGRSRHISGRRRLGRLQVQWGVAA